MFMKSVELVKGLVEACTKIAPHPGGGARSCGVAGRSNDTGATAPASLQLFNLRASP